MDLITARPSMERKERKGYVGASACFSDMDMGEDSSEVDCEDFFDAVPAQSPPRRRESKVYGELERLGTSCTAQGRKMGDIASLWCIALVALFIT